MRKNTTRGFLRIRAGFFLVVMGLASMSITPQRLWAKVEVRFKLSGTYTYLMEKAGDIDEARRGLRSQLQDMNQMDGYTSTFDWKEPTWSKDLRAELLFRITRNFGLSIGSGYILAENPRSYALDIHYVEDYDGMYYSPYGSVYQSKVDEVAEVSQKYTLSAIPLTLDVYFILPLNKNETVTVFAHIGGGFYFGRLRQNVDMNGTYRYEERESNEIVFFRETVYEQRMTDKSRDSAFGYQGGLGFDVKLTEALSISGELFGRQVVFRDWEGSHVLKSESTQTIWTPWSGETVREYEYTDSAYGNLWTYGVDCSEHYNPYTVVQILDEEPEHECYRNVRKSSINLNSYGFAVSLNLRFKLF
jgi:hypothetical protein